MRITLKTFNSSWMLNLISYFTTTNCNAENTVLATTMFFLPSNCFNRLTNSSALPPESIYSVTTSFSLLVSTNSLRAEIEINKINIINNHYSMKFSKFLTIDAIISFQVFPKSCPKSWY